MLRTNPRGSAIAAATAAVLCAMGTTAQAQNDDLFDLSLEELVNLSVTSVSRRAEPLADTTSAAYVITREDIERQGIRSIPDALRLAPGLSVQQIDANKWSIGARGHTGRFANKLLVLMDGRILYTPTFSGVFWDVQSTLIEEIERIEVIRGPGAAVWGSNAVNGVINIITRRPDGSDGGTLIAGTDPEAAPFAALQLRGAFEENGGWRAFAKYQEGQENETAFGGPALDEWHLLRAGYRAAIDGADNQFAFSAEAYVGEMGQSFAQYSPAPPYQTVSAQDSDVSGGFVTGEWNRRHQTGASSQAQFIVDVTDRTGTLNIGQSSVTLDGQHQWSRDKQDWIVGAQLRLNHYDIGTSPAYNVLTEIDDDQIFAGFIQAEFDLSPDVLSLTLGTKLEHNSLSPKDIEVMPTASLLWKPGKLTSVWASASRAVRTPAVGDLSVSVLDVSPAIPPGDPSNPFPLPLRARVNGNPEFSPETLYAYEAGVRGRISDRVSFDVAAFVFDYSGLRSVTPTGLFCDPGGLSPETDPLCVLNSDSIVAEGLLTNELESQITGGEVSLNWIVSETARVAAFVAYAHEEFGAGSDGAFSVAGYPELQASVRTDWLPTANLSVGLLVRYVDDIEAVQVSSVTQANLNIRWQVNSDWAMSAGVRNLLEGGTLEYRSELSDVVATEIERSAYVNVHYGF
ncbi:MAG: TonB-dependent receptor [Pseudomonadota bacterium]